MVSAKFSTQNILYVLITSLFFLNIPGMSLNFEVKCPGEKNKMPWGKRKIVLESRGILCRKIVANTATIMKKN